MLHSSYDWGERMDSGQAGYIERYDDWTLIGHEN